MIGTFSANDGRINCSALFESDIVYFPFKLVSYMLLKGHLSHLKFNKFTEFVNFMNSTQPKFFRIGKIQLSEISTLIATKFRTCQTSKKHKHPLTKANFTRDKQI